MYGFDLACKLSLSTIPIACAYCVVLTHASASSSVAEEERRRGRRNLAGGCVDGVFQIEFR